MLECVWCEEELDGEEEENPRKDEYGEITCDDCYEDEYMVSCICEEYYDTQYWEPTHFVLLIETDGTEPGFYRIAGYPIYGGPMIGGVNLYSNNIEKVGELNGRYNEDESRFPAHMLCRECSLEFLPPREKEVEEAKIKSWQNIGDYRWRVNLAKQRGIDAQAD